jgi:photosystem II stability/assembly factor-like uncharacterized protein
MGKKRLKIIGIKQSTFDKTETVYFFLNPNDKVAMRILVSMLILFFTALVAQSQPILLPYEVPVQSSFRGLSVINDKLAWVSGSQGWIGKTTDGGVTWQFAQVPSFEKSDFRSLYAFNADVAVIANAGSPATVLKTSDGGKTWATVYTLDHPDAFMDGIDFWNDTEGIIYGDAIDKRMLLLATHDGGKIWKELPEAQRPILSEGEGSFAASGTGIRYYDQSRLLISTGGKVSRLLTTSNLGKSWKIFSPPIIQGESGTGIFSLAFRDKDNGIVVGGNYVRDTLATQHILLTKDGGATWTQPATPTRGYRECVEYLSNTRILAAGPKGIDISNNGGLDWSPLSDETGYHVVKKARHGSLVIVAGNKKLARIK